MGDYRYKAFISYSHADEQAGAWLQRSLEQFRAPKDLARRLTETGEPLRLAPVFRDREDLPVAGNLNDAIQKALAESEFQIVLCSPNAAKSRWVNEEIKLFHRLHGPGRTFALILAGEPNAGGDQECFPQALRFALNREGEPTGAPAEPLAADARDGGDGKRYALLKTAAGMLGVNLDDLVRRDAQRRARAARNWVGASATITASMAFAAVYAINQRNEAQVMRGKAETLVEFMLSDLSDRLEPVGKLDILEEVGAKALDYYEDQDLKSLDASALSRRARGLMKLGQVDQRRGDLDAALKAYEAAFASTKEQLRRAPDDQDRIFDHAQSVFYLGSIAVERGDYDESEARFQQYFDHAQRLIAFDGKNPKWRLEQAYATTNLGVVKYNRGQYAESIPYFAQSADVRRILSEESPQDRKIAFAHASALSWLAYAQLAVGDFPAAISTLQNQLWIYVAFGAGNEALDYESLEKKITAERRLAQAQIALGDLEAAMAATKRAAVIGDLLISREPENLNSLANIGITARQLSYLSGLAGEKTEERSAARRALNIAQSIVAREPSQFLSKMNLGAALVRVIVAEAPHAETEAKALEDLLADPAFRGAGEDIDLLASGNLALAARLRASGAEDAARALASKAVATLRGHAGALSASSRQVYAHLLFEAGEIEEAQTMVRKLYDQGIRHPELLAIRQQLAGMGAG